MRSQMFFHILTIQRQVNWIFCNVGFAETPLAGIDSINNEDGSCDENSALSIVVFGVNIAKTRLKLRASPLFGPRLTLTLACNNNNDNNNNNNRPRASTCKCWTVYWLNC